MKYSFNRLIPATFIIFILVINSSFAQDYEQFRDYYRQTLQKNQIAGSSVMIIKDGDIVFSEHYGKANLETGQKIESGSIFHWASITKTFTGIAIMQLRDRGLLSLDDQALKYLSELKQIYDPNNWVPEITIKTLLNHSSGLRGSTWPWKSKVWHPHEPQTWDQLAAMFPYTEILFEPGSKWSYSNPGIILLGRIIEEITTEDFEYYMDKNVFDPLGMLESYYDFAPPHLIDRVCQSYLLQDGEFVPAIFNLNTGITVSNGGLMAPFTDMHTYLQFLMDYMDSDKAGIVLKRSSLESMFNETIAMPEGVPIDADHAGMGLCFFLEDIYGMRVIGHSGFQNGFHTHLYFHPESGYAYLIGYTSAGPNNRQMDDEIKRYIFRRIFDPHYDIVINDAKVVDGTGQDSYNASVGILNGEIVKLVKGNKRIKGKANDTIDAGGRVLAPGFIDIHTHCDWGMGDPETRGNLNYLLQGVTSVVSGNCGYGSGEIASFTKKYESIGIGTNMIPLTGFGWLRREVMGMEDRAPTQQEMNEMKELLKQSLLEGSWGISTGLQYVPEKYSSTEELIEVVKVLKDVNDSLGKKAIYTTHMRSEEDELIPAVKEAIQIAREAGVPLNISHLKANGRKNWDSMKDVFQLVNQAIENGLQLTADMYPYDKSATTPLASVLLVPDHLDIQSAGQLQQALKNRSKRNEIRTLTEEGIPGQTNWVAKGGWNYFSIVHAPEKPELHNKMFIDLAEEENSTPFDVAADLVIEFGDDLIISLSTMLEENLVKQMQQAWVMFSSDGSAVSKDAKGVHPRNYGSQVRVLRKYVRDEAVLTLEQAIYKLSGLPAKTMGLSSRGVIREGSVADLVLFDPDQVNDPATFLDPHQYAEGIDEVIINGVRVVKDGVFQKKYEGKVLLMM